MWRNAAATFSNGQDAQANQLNDNSVQVQNHVQNNHQELYHVDDVLAMIDNEQTTYMHGGQGLTPGGHPPVGVPPPEYSSAIKNRQPPSFEDHMRAAAAAAAASTSSLNTRMPSIDELLQQQEPVGNPPPPYPGTSTLITLQPPMSHTSSTHDPMTEGMF